MLPKAPLTSSLAIKNIINLILVLTIWWCPNVEWWEYQTALPASWETCMQVKKQQLEPDMEQRTGSKLGKEHIKAL